MSAIRGDEVGHIDRETMAWVRDDDATIRRMRARVAVLEEPTTWTASMVGLELLIKYKRGVMSIDVVKPVGEYMDILCADQSGEGGK